MQAPSYCRGPGVLAVAHKVSRIHAAVSTAHGDDRLLQPFYGQPDCQPASRQCLRSRKCSWEEKQPNVHDCAVLQRCRVPAVERQSIHAPACWHCPRCGCLSVFRMPVRNGHGMFRISTRQASMCQGMAAHALGLHHQQPAPSRCPAPDKPSSWCDGSIHAMRWHSKR